jgi:hypothetical protein
VWFSYVFAFFGVSAFEPHLLSRPIRKDGVEREKKKSGACRRIASASVARQQRVKHLTKMKAGKQEWGGISELQPNNRWKMDIRGKPLFSEPLFSPESHYLERYAADD